MSNACAEGESTFPLSTAAWPAPRHTLLFAWGFCAAGILSRPAAVLSNWSLFPPKPTPHPPTSGCRGDLEYKYVLLSDRDGSVACWQPGGNQVLHLGSGEQVRCALGCTRVQWGY